MKTIVDQSIEPLTNSGMNIWVIIGIVLALAIIAAAIYYFSNQTETTE